MCFVVIVLGKAVYFFSPLPLSKSRLAVNAPQSASCNVVPPSTLLPVTLFYSTQTVDSNLDGNAKAPTVPAQHVIMVHLMRFWPSHQYVLGDISLTRSDQTLGLQISQRFKTCPTDPDDIIFWPSLSHTCH